MESSEENVMIVETETVSLDTVKKRKTNSLEEIVSPKKRKVEVHNVDDDISIIENDITNDNTKSNIKIYKNSEDDDCLIVHDDNMQTTATSQ